MTRVALIAALYHLITILKNKLIKILSVELAVCALAVRDGVIPPTINLDNPDPECDLDYVPKVAREKKVRVAMSNSFGFGGHNVSLVVKEVRG